MRWGTIAGWTNWRSWDRQGLIGEWEGDEGLDVSYHHAEEHRGRPATAQKVTMNSFGPVDNGTQCLYGLSTTVAGGVAGRRWIRSTPRFRHWLWDAGAGHVIRHSWFRA
ncbi:MAG: hypothetical protein R2789_15780 [Microthrixaceae bacterium]